MNEWLIAATIALFLYANGTPSDAEVLSEKLAGIEHVSVEERDDLAVIFFDGYLFDTGQYQLSGDISNIIRSVALVLHNDFSSRYLYIEGHTDNVGDPDWNQRLSQMRADQVMTVFGAVGIKSDRVDVVGYGDTHPNCSNDTAEGRSCNRRVQVVVFRDQ